MENIFVQSAMLCQLTKGMLVTTLKQSILMEALHTIAHSVQRHLATRPATIITKQDSTSNGPHVF